MKIAVLNIGIERQKRIMEDLHKDERAPPRRELKSDELENLKIMIRDIDERLRQLPPSHAKHHGSRELDPAVLGHLVMPQRSLSPHYEIEERLRSINSRLAKLEEEIDTGLSAQATKEWLGKILDEIDDVNKDIEKAK